MACPPGHVPQCGWGARAAARCRPEGSLAQDIEALRADGWTIEGVSYSGTFVRLGELRLYLGVYPADRRDEKMSLHGKYPGAYASVSKVWRCDNWAVSHASARMLVTDWSR